MPLTFDLPLESLRTYQGINPCPDDFDDFWQAALKEMWTVDPELEFKPAQFECSFSYARTCTIREWEMPAYMPNF